MARERLDFAAQLAVVAAELAEDVGTPFLLDVEQDEEMGLLGQRL